MRALAHRGGLGQSGQDRGRAGRLRPGAGRRRRARDGGRSRWRPGWRRSRCRTRKPAAAPASAPPPPRPRCPRRISGSGLEGGIDDDGEPAVGLRLDRRPLERRTAKATAKATAKPAPPPSPCPPRSPDLVRQGVELGEADDRVFGRTGTRSSRAARSASSPSGRLDRAGLYEPAVVLRLHRFPGGGSSSRGRSPG